MGKENASEMDLLIDLQTRLEFQDRTIAELNEVITDQQGQLDTLNARLGFLSENLKILEGSVDTEQENEKPPHY